MTKQTLYLSRPMYMRASLRRGIVGLVPLVISLQFVFALSPTLKAVGPSGTKQITSGKNPVKSRTNIAPTDSYGLSGGALAGNNTNRLFEPAETSENRPACPQTPAKPDTPAPGRVIFEAASADLVTAAYTETKIVAADGQAGSQFGAVAIDRNTLAVGASGDIVGQNQAQGSVYVFVRNCNQWVLQAKLTASDGSGNDHFGRSVGLSGDTILVGAPNATIGGRANQGAGYIFVRNGITWTQQAKLFDGDGAAGDIMGESVGISGNTAVLGARLDDIGPGQSALDQGSASVFVRNGTNWTQQAKLIASDGAGGENFGMAARVDGDTIIVGAWFHKEGINDQQGAAYIFVRNQANQWTQQAKLLASDGIAGDWFGISAAISGDTAVVGARQDDLNPGTPGSGNGEGSAYIFVRNGTTWAQQAKLTASDSARGAAFGESAAILGDRVMVGAVFSSNRGAAYLIQRNGTSWTQQQKFTASDGAPSDFFGEFAALTQFDVVTSSFGAAIGQNLSQGAAYVYSLPSVGCGTFKSKKTGVFRPSTGELFLKNANSSGFADTYIIFGNPGDYPVAGDWNGDGVDSVGVYRNGVFYLRNTNTTGFADIVVPFGNPGDQPVVGDWDGDGIDTIGVYRNGTFLLRNSNTAGPPDLVFTLGNPGDVGIAGDWNGDGITTCGVFRPSNGIVYLKNSNTTGFADLSFVYGNAGDKPVAGDWNGDGIDTVGIYRNGLFFLTNSNTTGFADIVFVLGNSGDFPIAGNWNGSL